MICKRWICHSCVDFLAASSCTKKSYDGYEEITLPGYQLWCEMHEWTRQVIVVYDLQWLTPKWPRVTIFYANLDNSGGSFLSNWLPSAHWLSSSGSMLLPTNIDAASTHSIFRSQQQWQARDLRRDVATGLLAATQWQWVNIWDGVDCRNS